MQKKSLQVAPSILSADFGKLADEAKRVEQAGADAVHVDIMDGHFVPNLTMGPKIVSALNRATDLFLDVHLMIYNPFDFIERFIEAGADRLTFHFEATEDVEGTLKYIRKSGIKAGLAFCPETSMEMIPKCLDQCDLVLIMTVHPGFGGQAFMPKVIDKIVFTKTACDKRNLEVDIEVDGGIDETTAKQCVKVGANVLVSGTYLFKAPNMKEAILKLREAGA
jgi:ribulose-phosphate 3-epimerase